MVEMFLISFLLNTFKVQTSFDEMGHLKESHIVFMITSH